ncbi:MAG TPA: glycosyltransferase [Solirubrobacteraceae bacterium]|nr:glycosyltransferase [Solirubrobacteraceae bacterium]
MRALVVTNMYPTPARPALGSFVRDQVEALRRIEGVQVELFAFSPGGAAAYVKAAQALLRRHRATRYDVVHAHFGLSAWPAFAARGAAYAVTLHGTDLVHPRSRAITLAALPMLDLVATVSEPLATQVPGWAVRGRQAVLPCGVDLERFRPIPRAEARAALNLAPTGRYLLFPADPTRPEKRHDRALALAAETKAELISLGNVDPAAVPLYVNAANAVLVPSERESFGLAVLEALACNVPVLATPVGIAPTALKDLPGTLCTEFDPATWRAALEPHLTDADPRIANGRARAESYGTDRMAVQVLAAWRSLT